QHPRRGNRPGRIVFDRRHRALPNLEIGDVGLVLLGRVGGAVPRLAWQTVDAPVGAELPILAEQPFNIIAAGVDHEIEFGRSSVKLKIEADALALGPTML